MRLWEIGGGGALARLITSNRTLECKCGIFLQLGAVGGIGIKGVAVWHKLEILCKFATVVARCRCSKIFSIDDENLN